MRHTSAEQHPNTPDRDLTPRRSPHPVGGDELRARWYLRRALGHHLHIGEAA
ncbi:hypothetical protein QZH56_37020 (plasmid) [Streptomyces olivoreticuli]|uniref:hypothetical protein n=1 Tax=Streptomyces olivoreticuli TaxID=68246 RepID=UPI0026598912|nr:hypothetical protein [Streptomyces olivoreticuli]WKK27855.1 hypothetical protein QZH56_37020 [Streptomyces olivoreticuli]